MKKIQLYGDYHIHSEFSGDGNDTIDQIVSMAVKRGLREIAITDHGPATRGGLQKKNFSLVTALIAKANQEHPITVLQGIEANVTSTKGHIDVTDEMRTDLDIVLAGFHPGNRMRTWRDFFAWKLPNFLAWFFRCWTKRRIRKNTEIMKRVIEKNDIDIWVHPNAYFRLDVLEVAKACAERGTLVEINRRIAFRPIDFERMKALGVKFVLSSDYHCAERGHTIGILSKEQEAFLDAVDWEVDDFINMTGEFRRGEANLLKKIKEREYTERAPESVQEKPKPDKAAKREQKKRTKQVRRKAVD